LALPKHEFVPAPTEVEPPIPRSKPGKFGPHGLLKQPIFVEEFPLNVCGGSHGFENAELPLSSQVKRTGLRASLGTGKSTIHQFGKAEPSNSLPTAGGEKGRGLSTPAQTESFDLAAGVTLRVVQVFQQALGLSTENARARARA
jgi:hypothetical protein